MQKIIKTATEVAKEVPTSQGEVTGTKSGSQAAINNNVATSIVASKNNINNEFKILNMTNLLVKSEVKSDEMENLNKNEMKNKLETLKKSIEKEEKILKSMKKQGVNSTVLQTQQQVIDELKAELENFAEVKAAEMEIQSNFVSVELVDDETEKKEKVQKKIAFVENNRSIDAKKVASFITLIANLKYEKAYPVIAAKAKLLTSLGYTVKDITGMVISQEEAADYLVILDGQHRCKAFAQLIAAGQDLTIPNVRLRDVRNVGEYLNEINQVGNWKTNDKATVAALVNPENKLLKAIAGRLKEGFNYSSTCQIYTGKKLSEKVLNNALKGEAYTLSQDAKADIERGDKFITLCKAAGMDVKLITKRYFIEGFNHFALATSEEEAFKALEKLRNLEDKENRLKKVKEGDQFIVLLKEANSQAQ